MAMRNDFDGLRVEGWDKLTQEVLKMPLKLKRQPLLRVLRSSTSPVIRAVRKRVPEESGVLKRSVGNITGKNKEFPNILVGYRKTKAFDRKGFDNRALGTVLEFGTDQRFTKGRRKKSTGLVKGQSIYQQAFDESKDQVIPALEKKVAKMLEAEFR